MCLLHLTDPSDQGRLAANQSRIPGYMECAVDGKHIRVRRPPATGSEYYNYKDFYSMVLMVVVDAEYNFVFVDIGAISP